MDSTDMLAKRSEKVKKFFSDKTNFPYFILGILIVIGYAIRSKTLKNLIDPTTGNYIPLALDPFLFLRYAKETLTNGALSAVDVMRYVPTGYEQIGEFGLLSNVIVGLYKFLGFFNSGITLEYAHVVYPPILFCLSLIFFFLLISRLFDYRVGLLATAFLVVLPSYLYRTLAGFSDKESLAMFFMFGAMHYYVRAWQEKKLRTAMICGLFSGILTGLMGLTWGGVSLVFLIFGLFVLIEVVLDKFSEKDFYVYSVWLFSLLFILKVFFGQKYTVSTLALSVTSGFMFLAFLVGLINLIIRKKNLFGIKDKIEGKLPLGFASLIISGVLGVFFVTLLEGFGAIAGKASSFIRNLLEPFGFTRWNLTVAESHQPYVSDWIASWGWSYMLLMVIGSIILVYNLLKKTKLKLKGTAFYTFFIFAFIFSRYKAGATLNGVNTLSKSLYVGSLIALGIGAIAVYFYAYKKDKELYTSILNFDKNTIFVIVWFLLLTVAARGAIRLLHIYSPVTTVLVAYAFVKIFDYAKSLEINWAKFGVYGILLILLFLPTVQGSLTNMYTSANNQAKYTGPSYGSQWQTSMKWVRENTDEDAVFAHWWDYGYWVQTGGERATLTDGGNAGGYALNYFMGRHVITGQSETEALEFLYAKNATHLLMISDEIGKYPAFSSIGSDVDYDRYGWITTFQLDKSRSQERRNDTNLFYAGSYAFDEDFIFDDTLFVKQSGGIGAFLLPSVPQEDGTVVLKQPEAVVVQNGQQYSIPVECIFIEGKEIEFEQPGLKGCLMILPRVNGNQNEPFGAAIWISPKIRRTLFTQLYLYGVESENFKLVYDDSAQFFPHGLSLGVYNGRLIGPQKIWEMSYPQGLEPSEFYYSNELPDERVRES